MPAPDCACVSQPVRSTRSESYIIVAVQSPVKIDQSSKSMRALRFQMIRTPGIPVRRAHAPFADEVHQRALETSTPLNLSSFLSALFSFLCGRRRGLPRLVRAAPVLLCCAAGPLLAQEPPDVNIFSFADTSCAEWQRSKDQEPLRTIYGVWFRGFVSGYNFGNSANQVALDKMPDPDSMARYVDKYCQDNPRLPFIGAAIQLVQEIRQVRLPQPKPAQ